MNEWLNSSLIRVRKISECGSSSHPENIWMLVITYNLYHIWNMKYVQLQTLVFRRGQVLLGWVWIRFSLSSAAGYITPQHHEVNRWLKPGRHLGSIFKHQPTPSHHTPSHHRWPVVGRRTNYKLKWSKPIRRLYCWYCAFSISQSVGRRCERRLAWRSGH